MPDTVYNDAQFDDNGYSPANAGNAYYGDVTIREAVARLLNTVALQTFLDVGCDTCLSYLDSMEFSSLAYADSTVDSISIGGFTNGASSSSQYYAGKTGTTNDNKDAWTR